MSVDGAEKDDTVRVAEESSGLITEIINEIIWSPINLALVIAILVLLYKIVKGRSEGSSGPSNSGPPPLPKMKKRDMTLSELRQYDGNQPDGRILVAVNSKIFDVTKGRRFYGPGMDSVNFVKCRIVLLHGSSWYYVTE